MYKQKGRFNLILFWNLWKLISAKEKSFCWEDQVTACIISSKAFQQVDDKRLKLQALDLVKECVVLNIDLMTNNAVIDQAKSVL
jgi:hypothetical protein